MNQKILLQGITPDSHCDAVERVLTIDDLQSVTISVAYMRASGLELIREQLEAVATQTSLIAGIRNGVTTAQAFELGLELGCSMYAFDTGSRNIIYHPKIYLSRSEITTRVLIGSANLTYGGLIENIEASVELELDNTECSQNQLANRLQDELDNLVARYPGHVTHIVDNEAIGRLFDDGKLLDEKTAVVSTPLTGSGSGTAADVARIRLCVNRPSRSQTKPYHGRHKREAPTTGTNPEVVANNSSARWSLVWESNPLKRRALTIPTANKTNPTGSMLLGKGRLGSVDHRHHFRDVVFADLDWKWDEAGKSMHMERSSATFQLIIRNIDVGSYRLDVSHDTRTDSKSYQQGNSMTSLHWGVARHHIAHEELLGSQLLLYKNVDNPQIFLIEIDD